MKKSIIILAALAISITACKKDKTQDTKPVEPPNVEMPKQYSYWVVNEDSFSTNEVTLDIEKAICVIGNNENNHKNNFTIAFNVGYVLPESGYFNLATEQTQDPNIVGIGFTYNTVWYIPSSYSNSVLTASSENNKAKYTLPPTWFINYYNHSDSVLIHGVFREP